MSAAYWMAIGFLGQALFSMRFLVQWLTSEARGASVIPTAFWWFSIAGGITLFAYAVWRRDPVFIAGQATGIVIYVRNVMLLAKQRRKIAVARQAA
jgi:lipid-A-disaccharide synthase-like uncharacterized protein